METGTFRELGNVTNIRTCTENYRTHGITFNVGRGIMSTPDGQGSAPWRAYDIVTTDAGENRTWKGRYFSIITLLAT
jgi:hypothetical protein